MADKEATRKIGEAILVCQSPDVCKTPMGSSMVPVPYQIISFFNTATSVAKKVNLTGQPAFHMGSYLTTVLGDEAGVGGGVVSGKNKGKCYPITHSSTVRVEGQWLVRHDDIFDMNCGSPGNTKGKVVYIKVSNKATINADGEIEFTQDEEEYEYQGPDNLEEAWEQDADIEKKEFYDENGDLEAVYYEKQLEDGTVLSEGHFTDGNITYGAHAGDTSGATVETYQSKPDWWPSPEQSQPTSPPETVATDGSEIQSSNPPIKPQTAAESSLWSTVSPWLHGTLDVVGLVPGIGEIADASNALIYLAEGDKVTAAVSAAAMIPFLGWGAVAGKVGMKVGKKVVKEAAEEGAEQILKKSAKEVAEESVEKGVKEAKPTVGKKGGRIKRSQGELHPRQQIHKKGTNANKTAKNRKKGPPTEWKNADEADKLTHEAYSNGEIIKKQDNGSYTIEWDAGSPVGANGETKITVQVRKDGRYHGYPSGPKNPGN